MNQVLAVPGSSGNLEKIIVDNTLFSVHHFSIEDQEGKITEQSINALIRELFFHNLLHDAPAIIPALTKTGQPAILTFSYMHGLPSHAQCKIWADAPNFDAAVKYLSSHYQHQEGILIVSPKSPITPEEPKKEKYKAENPFPRLKEFAKKIYNGTLPHPELHQFVGKRFGTMFGYPYAAAYYFENKLMSYSPATNIQPSPGEKRYIQNCFFEITQVSHQGFLEQEDTTSLHHKVPMFQQLWRANLSYIDYAGSDKIEL